MNLQLIAIINEFLNKPAGDLGLAIICNETAGGGCDYTHDFPCNNCILGRKNWDMDITVHTRLNQIQVTCEYTLTSNSK